jgi:hypothetical protein
MMVIGVKRQSDDRGSESTGSNWKQWKKGVRSNVLVRPREAVVLP